MTKNYKLEQLNYRVLTKPKFFAKGTEDSPLLNAAASTRRDKRSKREVTRFTNNKNWRMDGLTNKQRFVFTRKAKEQTNDQVD